MQRSRVSRLVGALAPVAELADAADSKSVVERHEGSSPSRGTSSLLTLGKTPPSQQSTDVTATSSSDLPGLDPGEVVDSRNAFGSNEQPRHRSQPWWRHLLAEMTHFFAALLWAAAGLAWLAGLPQLSVAIALVVVINAVFSYVQERKAEHAAATMQDLVPRLVLVRREGTEQVIPAVELVVGDVALLDAGDRVPADGVIIDADAFEVNTSLLTGESVPVRLDALDGVTGGTLVVEGRATIRITAVGAGTRLASLATLTRSVVRPISPLEREMNRVVRTISIIAISTGLGFLVIAFIAHIDFRDAATLAIGVSVALVPEALLPTVTLSLALGAQRIARRDAVVRHLESVETLGSVTFICTDKTGTLTRNQMQVVRVWTPNGDVTIDGEGYEPAGVVSGTPDAVAASNTVAASARACSTGRAISEGGHWVAHGDPMEAAIDCLKSRLECDPLPPAEHTFPFDPRRRRMSVVLENQVFVKGAADAVLPLTNDAGGDSEAALIDMMSSGLRVLAVATRVAPQVPHSAAEAESDLTLLGLLGLSDPARPDAHRAIASCRTAGIAVAMVTGDHPATALAVAQQVGLSRLGDRVLAGDELATDEEALGEQIDHDGVVIARVSPEQKLAIARALQRRGHVVAMTGDGVNDGPALQEADIGVAMGASGSDVAREASDLVLLDDDFGTIVATIEQGRGTFLNVRRFLTYHLTDNVAELFPLLVWALSGGTFPLALGVLQILALDLATDTMTAVALGGERPHSQVMQRQPISGRLLNRMVAWRSFGLLGPTEAILGMSAFTLVLLSGGWAWWTTPPPDLLAEASGAYFMTVVTAQAGNALACRSSSLTVRELGLRTNRLLLWSLVAAIAIGLAMLVIPPLASTLSQAVPPLEGWAVILVAPGVVLAVDAMDKARRHRHSVDDQPRLDT
jgi:magnesium-transporting ATPase (P-type)